MRLSPCCTLPSPQKKLCHLSKPQNVVKKHVSISCLNIESIGQTSAAVSTDNYGQFWGRQSDFALSNNRGEPKRIWCALLVCRICALLKSGQKALCFAFDFRCVSINYLVLSAGAIWCQKEGNRNNNNNKKTNQEKSQNFYTQFRDISARSQQRQSLLSSKCDMTPRWITKPKTHKNNKEKTTHTYTEKSPQRVEPKDDKK